MTTATYPSDSPNRFDDWDKMLADLDRVVDEIKRAVTDALAHPKDVLPGLLRPVPLQVDRLHYEFRHVVQYARDAERGNAELRARAAVVWGSDCVSCGNATADSQRCDLCGSTETTVPLYYGARSMSGRQ